MLGGRAAWQDLFAHPRKTAKHLKADTPTGSVRNSATGSSTTKPSWIRTPPAPRYHMIHASDHPAAVEFTVWARRASETEKLHALAVELPFPPDTRARAAAVRPGARADQ
jgi:hypothetical protein